MQLGYVVQAIAVHINNSHATTTRSGIAEQIASIGKCHLTVAK